MIQIFTNALQRLSGFLQAHPPIAGVMLSLLLFLSAYQHFGVRDNKGGKFFQGLAGLILVLFALNAILSGMWLGLMVVIGALLLEVSLAIRQWRRFE
jgi:hypothetical protein